MLQKMGYKQGQAIGKGSTGIVEPIGITIKADRHGLGRENALKELKKQTLDILRKRKAQGEGEVTAEEFRKRMSQKVDLRNIETDIRHCQKTCQRLDEIEGVTEPVLTWFWPPVEVPINEDEEEEEEEEKETPEKDDEDTGEPEIEYEPSEKLEMITKFLRNSYSFCHWCGTHYDDVTDLMDNCPGPDKDEH